MTHLFCFLLDLFLSSLPSLHLLEALGEHARLLVLEHDDEIKDGAEPR